MFELPYGPVFIHGGRHKGRVLYYDDDLTPKTAICYAGHPTDFVDTYDILHRFMREPTVNNLLTRSGEIAHQLRKMAIHNSWPDDSWYIHELWSERSMISGLLSERRLFGMFGKVSDTKTVFLCHSSSDKGFVRQLNDDLKNVGQRVWLDEQQIKVGESIVEKISSGIDSSNYMIVIISKSSVASMWARREWQSFLARQLSRKKIKLLPLVIETCKIPTIISDLKFADFREDYDAGLLQILAAIQ